MPSAHPETLRPPAGATPADRALGATIAVLALAALTVASRLHPDPSGMGTHSQLGLPRCGFRLATGYPCPTCGMTTAFAHAAHAQPWDALRAQPFGALLALATAVALWAGLHVAVFGSGIGRLFVRLLTPRTVCIIAGFALASWVYKIAFTAHG